MAKERLDRLVVSYGFAPSGERARQLIMEGAVFINGTREDKAGDKFDPASIKTFEVKGARPPYVSRGGHKLEKALTLWEIGLHDLICIDIGASTGGFTDCMLQNGAAKVYAVDVGYGQLDYGLRTDPRVVSMEKTNFRYLTPADIGEEADFAGADVSFISLTKILPAAYPMLKDDAKMVTLIKPQFEAGRDKVGKKGVVKDANVHEEVIDKVAAFAVETGFTIQGLTFSPITGPEGNIEYLLYLKKGKDDGIALTDTLISTVVANAHETLTGRT